MIRPFRSETERYGEYSKAGEYVYDHPFLWGSKRTGPDLMREGGKYPDSWHYNHMLDPRSMSPGSIMPAFPWLLANKIDTGSTSSKISAMIYLGVPYPKGYSNMANKDLMDQATKIADGLHKDGFEIEPTSQLTALIAYLQQLGLIMKNKR